MKSLPFVVQPKRKFTKTKIGTPETGIVEIERRGYLTVSEKSFVDSVTQGTDGVTAIVSLATRVSAKTKHTIDDSFNAVMKAVQGDLEDAFALKIKEEYTDEISSILSQMADSMQKRSLAATTILIQSRIDPDWTIDDTLDQDPALLMAFADFYSQEESGLSADDVAAMGESTSATNGESASETEGEVASEIVGKSTEENGEK